MLPPAKPADDQTVHDMNKIVSYIQEVIKEMQKVSWPKRRELVDNTIVTVLASLFIAIVIALGDKVISEVLERVYALAA